MIDTVKDDAAATNGFGTEVTALFSRLGIESEIPQVRGYEVKNDRALLPNRPETS